MNKQLNNYAFIDSQNLNLGIKELGWELDFRRFRVYLKENFAVCRAYIFIGFLPKNQNLYNSLYQAGYHLIFKPIIRDKDGKIKGNIDAELVLQAMIDFTRYNRAVIVSGDGDFYCLIRHLYKKDKLSRLIVPNKFRYSKLLKRALPYVRDIVFMNDKNKILSCK
ncbi:MAG: NYN domain-containing protein [Patescibacteria group bacterium]